MSDNPFASPETPDTAQPSPRRWGSRLLKLSLIAAIIFVAGAILLPNPQRVREVARRSQCKDNLKQIGLALHNYHDEYGSFPPAYTVDSNGRMLHSWRSLLLPYLEQQHLYRQIDFSKPWYDSANAAAFEATVDVFQCRSTEMPTNHTIYLGVSGPDCCFHADTQTALTDIKDGTSNTMIVLEVPQDRTVPWMSPQDADEAFILGISKDSKLGHQGGFQVLLGDGAARFISADLDRMTLRALLTISGNETVGGF